MQWTAPHPQTSPCAPLLVRINPFSALFFFFFFSFSPNIPFLKRRKTHQYNHQSESLPLLGESMHTGMVGATDWPAPHLPRVGVKRRVRRAAPLRLPCYPPFVETTARDGSRLEALMMLAQHSHVFWLARARCCNCLLPRLQRRSPGEWHTQLLDICLVCNPL